LHLFLFLPPPLATPLTTFVLLYSSSCFPTLFSSPPWLWHGNVAVGAVVRRCVGFTLRTSALGHGHGCEIGTQPRTSFSSGTVDETTNGRLPQGYSRIEDKGPLPSVSLCRRPSFILLMRRLCMNEGGQSKVPGTICCCRFGVLLAICPCVGVWDSCRPRVPVSLHPPGREAEMIHHGVLASQFAPSPPG
jgi:hypothetical protein